MERTGFQLLASPKIALDIKKDNFSDSLIAIRFTTIYLVQFPSGRGHISQPITLKNEN